MHRRRRFMLVDSCLVGLGSHPYHYAVEVLGAAARAGCDGFVIANRACTVGPLAGAWPVRPVFSMTAYSKYTVAGGIDRLDDRGRSGWLPRPPWEPRHAARRREERIDAFARQLAPMLAELRSGDVVLLATASELEIAGLARAVAAARPAADVAWHAVVHFPCYRGFPADYERQDRRLGWARTLLEAAVAALPGLRIHATTEDIAAQHTRLAGTPVGVLPYPIVAPEPATPRQREGRGGLRVSCLGDARPEKGTQAIPAVVAAAATDPRLAGLRFMVQTNLGFDRRSWAPEHREIRRGLESLRRRAASGGPIDLLPGPLDAAAYSAALSATDIMLLPYDQERYRARCSGIVLESLAAGVVPVVTGGGWMARQLAEPLRRHAAALTARAAVGAERRIDRPRLGPGRSLTVDLPGSATDRALAGGPVAAADGHEVIAVEVEWQPGATIAEPAVRVAVAGAGAATVLAADGTGRSSIGIFPRDDGSPGHCRIVCSPHGHGEPAVAAVVVRRLVVAGPAPAGAVGAVIAAAGDAVAALRDLVRHFPHYRETALRHAAAVREAASGDAVLRRLLP